MNIKGGLSQHMAFSHALSSKLARPWTMASSFQLPSVKGSSFLSCPEEKKSPQCKSICQAGHLCSNHILMPFWYQSQALLDAVTARAGTKGGEAAFPTDSVFLSHFKTFHTLLLFPQAMGLWTSEICKCISATNTEFCCFWDYLFMNLKINVYEKFLIKCPGCKLIVDRGIIACLGWSLHNPFKITLKVKKENLTDKNWHFIFFLLKNGEELYQIFL